MLPDVKMPWFMLGVIYAGLMFLLKDTRTKGGDKVNPKPTAK